MTDETDAPAKKARAKKAPPKSAGLKEPASRGPGKLRSSFFRDAGESHHQPSSRPSRKTVPLQRQILKALDEHGPLCLSELVHVMGVERSPQSLEGHLRTLMHTEQVRASIEINRTYHERLVFILSEKAPSGIWDRTPIKGFEKKKNEFRQVRRPPSEPDAESQDAERETLALEMMQQAMKLMKMKRGD